LNVKRIRSLEQALHFVLIAKQIYLGYRLNFSDAVTRFATNPDALRIGGGQK